jgi:hypothetical protein
MKIEIVDPASLRLHPLLQQIPDPDPELIISITCDIEDRGIDYPLLVDEKDRVIDGRIRLGIAKAEKLPVPIKRVATEDAATIIVQSLLQRRHFTKSSRGYQVYPFLETMVEEARARQTRCLKQGSRSPTVGLRENTIEEIADEAGFSRSFFFLIANAHTRFRGSDRAVAAWDRKHPEIAREIREAGFSLNAKASDRPLDLRERFEPDIISGALRLDHLDKAISGKLVDGRKHTPEGDGQLVLQFVWKIGPSRLSRWDHIPKKLRDKALRHFRSDLLPAFPEEFHEEYRRFLREQKLEARR